MHRRPRTEALTEAGPASRRRAWLVDRLEGRQLQLVAVDLAAAEILRLAPRKAQQTRRGLGEPQRRWVGRVGCPRHIGGQVEHLARVQDVRAIRRATQQQAVRLAVLRPLELGVEPLAPHGIEEPTHT
eukprot:scaffold73265_cov69-Phaeocystis_antarctica.AAC.4